MDDGANTDAPSRRRSSWLDRNVVLLSLASLFGDLSTEMLYPILPGFLVGLGASGSIIGLIDGVAQASQNIVQGASGALSDRLQRRKPIALVGFFLAAIAKPLIGLAPAWQGVMGARLLDRVGAGTRSAPRDALIASSVAAEDRGRAFGLEGAGDNLGAFLGPLLAIVLLTAFQFEPRWLFFIAVVPGLVAFLMVLLVRERPSAVVSKVRLDFRLRMFPRTYWTYLAVTALFCLGNSSTAFLILETQGAGASLDVMLFIYAGFNLVAALISYPSGLLSDRFGRKTLLSAALLMLVATYLGFALTTGLMTIVPLFAAYGVFQGIFRGVGKAYAADLVPEHLRASGIGWYGTTVGLLQLVASVVAGVLWDHAGHQSVFLYGAAFAAAGFIAVLLFLPKKAVTLRVRKG